jgi:hypothetical protein
MDGEWREHNWRMRLLVPHSYYETLLEDEQPLHATLHRAARERLAQLRSDAESDRNLELLRLFHAYRPRFLPSMAHSASKN